MSISNKSSRRYYGRFAIKKISPPYVVKESGPYEMVDSHTFNIIIPITEAKNLVSVVQKAVKDNVDTINIKIELREEKRRKSDGLSPCTVTYSPYD